MREHDIVKQVYAAKHDAREADELVRMYLPFIKGRCAEFLGRMPEEGHDDELGIAMFAFYEAARAYECARGPFLPFASKAIKNRLIDYTRRRRCHMDVVSLDAPVGDGDDSHTLLDRMGEEDSALHEKHSLEAAKAEIAHYTEQLALFGLSTADIADNSPKQERTLRSCHLALAYARSDKGILQELISTKKLPMNRLAEGSGVERKTLERHRRYLVALLLAYTNGFEIIRGHLRRSVAVKGGELT